MARQELRNFRANLALLCSEHGMVQEIAQKAKVSRVHLSRVIHGKTTPTIDIALRLADALDVPLSDLLESEKIFVRG